MNDQAGITFDARHVRLVVVNAMAVEGERREAEQQNGVGSDLLRPGGVGRRRLGFALLLARPGGLALDDVVLLDEGYAFRS